MCESLSAMGDLRQTLWLVAIDEAVTADELAAASRELHRTAGLEATVDAALLAVTSVSHLVTAAPDVVGANFTPQPEALQPLGDPTQAERTVAAAGDFLQGCVHSVGMNIADPFLQDQLREIHDGPLGSGVYIFTLMAGGALAELDDDTWAVIYRDFVESAGE